MIATQTRPGHWADSTSGVSPNRARAAARALVTSTSAPRISSINLTRSAASARSSESRRFPPLSRRSRSGEACEVGSGRRLLMICRTSAPPRASSPAHSGPAHNADISTTRRGLGPTTPAGNISTGVSPSTATGNCNSMARSRNCAADSRRAAAATASQAGASLPVNAGTTSRSSGRARFRATQPPCASSKRQWRLAERKSGVANPPGASRSRSSDGDIAPGNTASRRARTAFSRFITALLRAADPSRAPAQRPA